MLRAMVRRLKRRTRRADRHKAVLGRSIDWLLEDRRMLAGLLMPADTVDSPEEVLHYYGPHLATQIPVAYTKYITISNHWDQTIYPFLEGKNDKIANTAKTTHPEYASTGNYNPYDPVNHEYRGYIGYTETVGGVTTTYAGLKPYSQITVPVPIAFWDSGRINISTDGVNQFKTGVEGNNAGNSPGAPFFYHDFNTQALYQCYIDAAHLDRLYFVPVFDSFDAAAPHNPTSANWVMPPELRNGLKVTGKNLPSGNPLTITLVPGQNYVQLSGSASGPHPVDQYTFQSPLDAPLSPTARYTSTGFELIVSNGSTTTDGAVMWYHALKAENPGNDAAFQLTEVTFRSDWYDKTKSPTNFELFMGPGEGGYLENNFDAADYDVSYVDTAFLPVAMEARAVPIQSSSPVVAPPFGWVGSPSTVETFQTAYKSFVNNTDNILGSYFGTHGYPEYNAFNPDNFVKLPAGQNIFLQSPFSTSAPGSWKTTDGSLTYNLNQLNSGGSLPAQLPGIPDNSSVAGTKNLFLQTNTDERKQILTEIQEALSQSKTYSFSYNTTGTDILVGNVTAMLFDAANPPNLVGVVLDQDLTADALNRVYTPRLKPTDFAGVPIAQLFFTWANHYATHVVSNPPASPVAGTVSGSTLTLANPEAGLVPGMKVTGPGGVNYGVILTVNPDNKTLLLSQNPGAGPFSFAKPNVESIVGYASFEQLFPGSTPLLQQFEFASSEQAYALEFAQTVYTVMSAWSVTVDFTKDNPPWVQLMVNVVGGNFYAPMELSGPAAARLTVLQKSALRGIPDFTNPLYSDPSLWYPDPSVRQTTGQSFNVFNLMPYVWLMHAKLGVIAYTFSLDDDVGNVNAKGATHVDISVGGLQTTLPGNKVIGLLNTDQFTPPANYGVVSTGLTGGVPAPGSSLLGGGTKGTPANLVLDTNFAYQVLAFDNKTGAAGATVNSAGIPVGTSVETQIIGNPRTQDGLLLTNPMGVTSAPYHFFGTQVYVGSVLGSQATNTIILDPDEGAQYAYLSLLKMGPLQNIRVQGPGIPPDSIVTIQNVTKGGDGKVTLTLSSSLHASLVKPGSYAYSFGGPIFPTIRNPGFEFGLATDVTGRFLVGEQAAGAKAEWKFTPGSNGPTDTWESGVQYGNGATSKFTNGNPVAPQGLQVGFIQGDSKIEQKINLAPGHYQIGFLAAQSAAFPGQTLQVTIADSGGNVLHTENVTPVGTNYSALTTQPFTASRSGLYTVTLKGTVLSTATVLFDQMATVEVEQGALLSGDFNADGLTDIATRLVDGDWQVSLTQAAGNATLVSLGASTNNNWTTNATWVDWTVLRSGDRDVIVARAEVASAGTWWKLSYNGPVGGNSAENFSTNFVGTWAFSNSAQWIDVVSGDFDGNAKLDIIGRNSANGQWWMLQNAAENSTPGTAAAKNVYLGAWSSEVQWDRTLVGNFTGNSSGKAQVAGLTGTTWWLSEYEGTPGQMTHTQMTTQWSREQNYTDYVVGNFDGNANGAVLIAGKTANNAWYSIGYSSSVTPQNNLPSLMGLWPDPTSTYSNVLVGDFFGTGGGTVGIAGVQRSGSSLTWQVLQRGTGGGSYSVKNFGTWPQSTLAQAFAGLFSSSDVASKKTGVVGRGQAGGVNEWYRGVSNGSAFTVLPVTGYPV